MKINVYTTHDKWNAHAAASSRRCNMAQCATGDNDPGRQHALWPESAARLVVRGQTILAVIPESDIPSGHRHCVDLHGRLVTPGLIDCHTHLVFGGDRAAEWEQRLNGVSYQTISAQGGGINATVTATRSSSPETLLRLAQQRLQRLIDEGVTTVEIKSGYGLNAEAEEKMLQVARQLGQNNPVEISQRFWLRMRFRRNTAMTRTRISPRCASR